MNRNIILATIFAFACCFPAYAANEWRKGTGNNTILGSELINDIDKISFENIVDPLDRVLAGYRNGAIIEYSSATQVTVSQGSVVCENADGSVRKMRQNTSTTTVTWSDLDTGAEASSTTYYLYANCDADATTFTVDISASATSPSGTTSYKKLGTFLNNASSNISRITNYDDIDYHTPDPSDTSEGTSFSAGTQYQNTTGHKLLIVWEGSGTRSGGWVGARQDGYVGETSASTIVASFDFEIAGSSYFDRFTGTFVVPDGHYWKVTNTSSTGGIGITGSVVRIEAWEI